MPTQTCAEISPRRRAPDYIPVAIGIVVIVLTTLPYLIGQSLAHGRVFMGCLDNVNDYSAYLAWMRQGMEGEWYGQPPFDAHAPPILVGELFYGVLGMLCRVTHISLITGFQCARLLFDILLLCITWLLIKTMIEDGATRRAAMMIVCLSSGFGFLTKTLGLDPSIDQQQPEAILFYTAQTFPNLAFSQALQIGALLFLLAGERTGQMRYAVCAGATGLIIALTHTYDCVSLTAVWALYVAAQLIMKRPDMKAGLLRTCVAMIIAIPGLAPVLYEVTHNKSFGAQTNISVNSQPFIYILIGYGLPLLLALAGIWHIFKRRVRPSHSLFLICWLAANIAVSYAPIWAQRKMLQGAQYPIGLLAGIGLVALLRQIRPACSAPKILVACMAVTALAMPTNIMMLMQNIDRLHANRDGYGLGRLYLQPNEAAALSWIERFAPHGASVQALPWIAVSKSHIPTAVDTTMAFYTPALTDHPVYAGDIWLSPNFFARTFDMIMFESSRVSDVRRRMFLKRVDIRYVIAPHIAMPMGYASIFSPGYPTPSYLKPVYSNPDETIYLVTSPT